MDIKRFLQAFQIYWPRQEADNVSPILEDHFTRTCFDPCPDVRGMSSIKKLRLLNVAYSCLGPDESYLEVGTWIGKSLIAAMKGQPSRTVYACDNFSKFNDFGPQEATHQLLLANLQRYGLSERVQFFNGDFRGFLTKEQMPVPVGVFFNDGPHDEEGQHDAIIAAENILADEALVLIDDWGRPEEPQFGAKAGTERAIAKSSNHWKRLMELPSRFNGDHGMWWNGVGVYSFRRRK